MKEYKKEQQEENHSKEAQETQKQIDKAQKLIDKLKNAEKTNNPKDDPYEKYIKDIESKEKAHISFDKNGSLNIKTKSDRGNPYDTTGLRQMYYDSLRKMGVPAREAMRRAIDMYK